MEIIVSTLMLFIVIGSLLKISFNKFWYSMAIGTVAAIFIVATYPYATLQSKTQLTDYLQNTNMMQNIAVLVTIESLVMFAFDFLSLQRTISQKRSRTSMQLLGLFPGLLLFPVLFVGLTQSIFSLPGINFSMIAWGMATLLFILIPTFSYGVRLLLPDEELRFEVHFIVNMIVATLGLITTVNGHVTYAAIEQPLNWSAVATAIGTMGFAFLLGYGYNRIKWRMKRNTKSN